MVITVVTQRRGEPSATSRLVSPTRRELRPKARSESREFRLIFEPAQFPWSSTTRAQHTNDKDVKEGRGVLKDHGSSEQMKSKSDVKGGMDR